MFARAALRGLTPEQFFDSLAEAVGYYQPFRTDNPFLINDESPRARFLELYRSEAESPLQRDTTILQALAMMNGDFVAQATSLEDSQTLRAVVEFPLMSEAEKLETLFLATLSRRPTSSELETMANYLREVSANQPAADQPAADDGKTVETENSEAETDETKAVAMANRGYSDVYWVLLNSSEFLLNH